MAKWILKQMKFKNPANCNCDGVPNWWACWIKNEKELGWPPVWTLAQQKRLGTLQGLLLNKLANVGAHSLPETTKLFQIIITQLKMCGYGYNGQIFLVYNSVVHFSWQNNVFTSLSILSIKNYPTVEAGRVITFTPNTTNGPYLWYCTNRTIHCV